MQKTKRKKASNDCMGNLFEFKKKKTNGNIESKLIAPPYNPISHQETKRYPTQHNKSNFNPPAHNPEKNWY